MSIGLELFKAAKAYQNAVEKAWVRFLQNINKTIEPRTGWEIDVWKTKIDRQGDKWSLTAPVTNVDGVKDSAQIEIFMENPLDERETVKLYFRRAGKVVSTENVNWRTAEKVIADFIVLQSKL